MSAMEQRVEAMIQHYAPEKVSTVPTMLAQYKGKEGELLVALKKRYGPEPGAPGSAKAPVKTPMKTKAPAGKGPAPPGAAKAAPASASPKKVKAPAGGTPSPAKGAGKAPLASPGKKAKAPPGGASPAKSKAPPGTMAQRVEAMMKHYDPDKAGTVPTMLERYAGKEGDLLEALKKRYGPEPGAAPGAKAPAKTPMKTKAPGGTSPAPAGGTPAGKAPLTSPGKKAKAPPGGASPAKSKAPPGTMAQRVEAMMKHYDPDKAGTVPTMLERYAGKEGDLLEALKKRYGPEPGASASAGGGKTPMKTPGKAPAGGGTSPAPTSGAGTPGTMVNPKDYHTRVTRIMQKYDPSKVSAVPTMLERYKGKEGELLEALKTRYGPEPPLRTPGASPAATTPAPATAGAPKTLPPPGGKTPLAAPPGGKVPAGAAPAKTLPPPTATTTTGAPVASSAAGSPAQPAAPATPATSASLEATPMPQRVERFMKHYDPAKAGTVPAMLAKYKGKEGDLLEALKKRYGPEPPLDASPSSAVASAQPQGTVENRALLPPQSSGAASTAAPATAAVQGGSSPPLSTGTTPGASAGIDGSVPHGPTAVPAGATSLVQVPTDVRVRRYLLRYEPAKVSNAEKMLERYQGKEDQLLTALAKRFGAEPGIDFAPAGYQAPGSTATATTTAQPTPQPAASAGTAPPTGASAATAPPSPQREDTPSAGPTATAPDTAASGPPGTAAAGPVETTGASVTANTSQPQQASSTGGAPAPATGSSGAVPTTSAAAAAAPTTTTTAAAAAPAPAVPAEPPVPEKSPEEQRADAIRDHLKAFCKKYAPAEEKSVDRALKSAGPQAGEELIRQLHRKHGVPMPVEEPAWLETLRKEAMAFGLGEHYIAGLVNEFGADETAVRSQMLLTLFPDFALQVLADERQVRGFVAQRLSRFLSVYNPDHVPHVGDILAKYEDRRPLQSALGDVLLRFHGESIQQARLHTVYRDAVVGVGAPPEAPVGPDGRPMPGIFNPTQLREHSDVWSLQRARLSTPDFTGGRSATMRLAAVAHQACNTALSGEVNAPQTPTPTVDGAMQTEEPPRFHEAPAYDPEREKRMRDALTTNFAEARRMRAQEMYGTTAAQREALNRNPIVSAFAEYGGNPARPRRPSDPSFDERGTTEPQDTDLGPDPSWNPGVQCAQCPFYRRQVAELQQQVNTLQVVARLRKLDLEEKFDGAGECRGCGEKAEQIQKLQQRLHVVRVQRDARASGNYGYDAAPFDNTMLPQRTAVGKIDMGTVAMLREPHLSPSPTRRGGVTPPPAGDGGEADGSNHRGGAERRHADPSHHQQPHGSPAAALNQSATPSIIRRPTDFTADVSPLMDRL